MTALSLDLRQDLSSCQWIFSRSPMYLFCFIPLQGGYAILPPFALCANWNLDIPKLPGAVLDHMDEANTLER